MDCGEPTYKVPKDGTITFTLEKSDNNVCLKVSVIRKNDGLELKKSLEVCPGTKKLIPIVNTYEAVEVILKVECAGKYDGLFGATVTGGVDPGTEANKK